MKRLLTFMLFMSVFCVAFAQTNKKFAVCKVVEKKDKVEILFSKDVKYLGTDYEKNVLYFDKKKLKFSDGQEAVSYLSSSWSWILCGNPTPLKKGGMMWTLKHEIDNNIVNFVRNMRALEEGSRRYYNMYYDYDGYESH